MYIALFISGIISLIIATMIVLIIKASGGTMTQTRLGGFVTFFVVLIFVFFVFFKPWSFVDNYELGYVFDSRNGEVRVLNHTGYVARTPFFESVHTIDLRPRQVCINIGDSENADSANQRVLNCKLVRFNPKGLLTFISWHGRGDYYGTRLNDLLKIYAYDGSGRSYPFLDVMRELKDDGLSAAPPVANTTPAP